MFNHIKQYPANLAKLILLLFLFAQNNSAFARTQIINADIDSIEPIYMQYNIEKLIKPCESLSPGCWKVNYKKRALKSLQGYRIKLSYQGKTFTARMREKPNTDQLKIRVSDDLLKQPNNVAINAALAH